MAFHFPVMPRLYMALHQEDRFPIIDILEQTPADPGACQWCMFLRNHDELTLEMVTDEERDYMYRAYAADAQARINLGIRRRLAPLLRNDRRRIELMNALLFSMPGTPVIYYGDEIGMGDNIYLGDRNGVRTPMQWSSDRNAGFSRANPQKLYLPVIIDPEYHYETVNVEAQQNNPSSLLWWMKRLIALRKQYQAFGRGTIAFLRPENTKILAFVREFEGERLLVVANLSRFVQFVRARPVRVRRAHAVRAVRPHGVPRLSARAVPAHARPARLLLVLLSTRRPRVVGVIAERPRERRRRPASRFSNGGTDVTRPGSVFGIVLERAAFKDYLSRTRQSFTTGRSGTDARPDTFAAASKMPVAGPRPRCGHCGDADFLARRNATPCRCGWDSPRTTNSSAAGRPGAVVAQLTKLARPDARRAVRRPHRPACYAAALLHGHRRGQTPFRSPAVKSRPSPSRRFATAAHLGRSAGRQSRCAAQPATRPDRHLRARLAVLKTYFERLEDGIHPAVELGRFLTEHTTGYDRGAPFAGDVEHATGNRPNR